MEHTDELSIIGHTDVIELPAVVSSNAVYVHRLCIEFSPPYSEQGNTEEEREQMEEARVKGIVVNSLNRKCAFCGRHGASIPCKVSKV